MNYMASLTSAAGPRPKKEADSPATQESDRITQRPAPGAEYENRLDRRLRSVFAPLTGGGSPWAALQAWEDWGFHLAISPVRVASLGLNAWSETAKLVASAAGSALDSNAQSTPEKVLKDRRFRDPAWRRAPYRALAENQVAAEAIWEQATTPLPGVSAHHMNRVRFMGEQMLHALAPSNFAWTNPRVIDEAARTGGASIVNGIGNFLDDLRRRAAGQKFFGAEEFQLGRNLATTKGSVIFRNDLIELIQYAPTTTLVHREPVLIVPAWIMKYYILDLSSENSLIRYLVDQGFTVFCISWMNPGAADRNKGLNDYRTNGVLAALEAVNAVAAGEKVHAVGYCLGGTMLAIAAAALDGEEQARLASLTFLAAQTDFSEAGDLMMFVDESQIAVLEDIMNAQGYLDARQMSGAFYALRANEMLWLRLVERYLLGMRRPATDLDAWFSDPTRMPARMHSEYLRWLFLENRLAQGNFYIDGKAVALKDLHTPIYAVGAEQDHIAPWRSVYKIALFSDSETTFVLSGGGHNSAIVTPPAKPGAYFRSQVVGSCAEFVDPDEWLPQSRPQLGSWWPHWRAWLASHGSAEKVPPPPVGAPLKGYFSLGAAPGRYALQS